ncbi:DUF2892 domain-containing protein [Vibrio tubiashii]|uniref:YgaP family membrane protein n=1 Tax=Vibrio tubiashii TaxID=29498 RepID=UPI001EFC5760|nr:DUF2892 domain-containing protein [Vibrio tubiashii]MCG9580840.1 DUF2892 domain-containing protein [Vibrio tubiashii]MCG9614431.1 DUF2892 domain-containing protein [Vibrio tubiashii]MCG9689353.1 DUF2892 domain-containing protein [Vibrio tubiashii]
MTLENAIRVLVGGMVILSVGLTMTVSSNFVWLTLFVGANLIQSAFTGFCPAVVVLKKLGFK